MTLMYDLGMPMAQYQPLLRKARIKQMKAVEKWRTEIFDELRAQKKIPPNVSGLPMPAVIAIRDTPLPSLEQLG